MNLKPTDNVDVQKICADAWAFWKKYMYLNNADPDPAKHFTPEIWNSIMEDADAVGKKWDECKFACKLIVTYIDELEARDMGAYPDPNTYKDEGEEDNV